MVAWAIKSLPFVNLSSRPANTQLKIDPSNLIFICLQDHEEKFKISKKLKDVFGKNIKIILIPEVTRGAAETVYKAKEFINIDEDIIISDSDHFFEGNNLYEEILNIDEDIQGIIPVFQPPDKEPKWSYTLFDNNKIAKAVAEKDEKLASSGAYANIGAYYFKNGKILVDEIKEMIEENKMYGSRGKEEFFVAPIFQRLIDKGYKIRAAISPSVWGLGTPKDLEYFLYNHK